VETREVGRMEGRVREGRVEGNVRKGEMKGVSVGESEVGLRSALMRAVTEASYPVWTHLTACLSDTSDSCRLTGQVSVQQLEVCRQVVLCDLALFVDERLEGAETISGWGGHGFCGRYHVLEDLVSGGRGFFDCAWSLLERHVHLSDKDGDLKNRRAAVERREIRGGRKRRTTHKPRTPHNVLTQTRTLRNTS
jgi:hypothetical protein